MDSTNSTSDHTEMKTEVDSDSEASKRVQWNSENTSKLIDLFEKECRELWDTKHLLNKDRTARQAKLEYLAKVFGTNAEEISRKLHNLRTQFNNELRKLKRKAAFGEASAAGTSGWEYFDALMFLLRQPLVDNTESMDAVNLALAEFQADEELEFEMAARARQFTSPPTSSPKLRKPTMRVSASAPNPIPLHTMLWNEEPRIIPVTQQNIPDECQIFGDFVASELRALRSIDNRNQLKRIIQKAILQVTEEEEAYMQVLRRNRRGSSSNSPWN